MPARAALVASSGLAVESSLRSPTEVIAVAIALLVPVLRGNASLGYNLPRKALTVV